MIGIFVGIAAVVALISLSQGMQTAISEQFLGLGTDKIIVQAEGGGFGPPGTGVPVYLTEDDKNHISKVKGIDLAVGRLIRIVQIEFKNQINYHYAVTLPDDTQERDLVIEANDYQLAEGRFPDKGDSSEILIGGNIAESLFDKPLELRNQLIVQGRDFKIVGILKKSGNPQKDDSIVLPEKALRNILDLQDEYDIIPARIASGEDLNLVTANVAKELRKFRDVEEGKEDFVIQTPQQLLGILQNILAIIQGVLISIAAISLVVGGVGIMNTMYTAVVERTREIGILKAVGATPKKIQYLFLIESGFLGLIGGTIGVILGYTISKSIELIAGSVYETLLIKADFSLFLMIGALLFSFTIGALSGALPARQAAKLHPVEALRK